MTETSTYAVSAGRGNRREPMPPVGFGRGTSAVATGGSESGAISADCGPAARSVSERAVARHRDLRVTTDDGVVLAVRHRISHGQTYRGLSAWILSDVGELGSPD
jgi:hypothetical protein